MEIKFKGLPFEPVQGQVIYYEEKHDSKINRFICNNYDWLVTLFRSHDLEFCYMPIKCKEIISYYAPYAPELDAADNVQSLASYAVEPVLDGPALVLALDIPVKDDDGNTVLQCVPIKTTWYKSTKGTFKDLLLEIKRVSSDCSIYYHRLEEEKRRKLLEKKNAVRYSLGDSDDGSRYSIKSEDNPALDSIKFAHAKRGRKLTPEDKESVSYSRKRSQESYGADEHFDYYAQVLIDEIAVRIKALQMRGINTMFLRDIISNDIKLSRLCITKDKKIILVDYENREIQMTALVKAVFLLFLKHPEGIRFKELPDYYQELLQIYQSLNPKGSLEKQQHSISEITNPLSNSINEKCARIREAFIASFDERMSQHYFVTGKRGEAKRITLDRSLVIWEE